MAHTSFAKRIHGPIGMVSHVRLVRFGTERAPSLTPISAASLSGPGLPPKPGPPHYKAPKLLRLSWRNPVRARSGASRFIKRPRAQAPFEICGSTLWSAAHFCCCQHWRWLRARPMLRRSIRSKHLSSSPTRRSRSGAKFRRLEDRALTVRDSELLNRNVVVAH